MLQREHRLDHARDTRCRLEVTEIGLDRADPKSVAIVAVGAVDRRQRLHFDRVAERGARAVRLDVAHAARLVRLRWRAPRELPPPGPGRSAPSGRCWDHPG